MKVNANYITAFCCHVRYCLLSEYIKSKVILMQISLQTKNDQIKEYYDNTTRKARLDLCT